MMASYYHGSTIRSFAAASLFKLRQSIRQTRQRSQERSKYSDDPELVSWLGLYDKKVLATDWSEVHKLALAIGERAKARAEPALMTKMGQALERLGDDANSADIRLAARIAERGLEAGAWRGEDISGKTLALNLLDPYSIGRTIRFAGFIGAAAARAKHTLVTIEARLVPILQRSFPGVEVRAEGNTTDKGEAEVVATFEDLAAILARDAKTIESEIMPLRADPRHTAVFRERYLAREHRPLIGISWGSKSHAKDVPNFSDWRELIAQMPATFVSLQYGKIDAAIQKLRDGNPNRLIVDPTVDQLVDMDGFAAQIASLDAVISIAVTAADLAGALGVPTIVVIDDKFHTSWPVIDERTSWYPHVRVVQRKQRPWSAVLMEVHQRLSEILAKSGDETRIADPLRSRPTSPKTDSPK